MPNAAQLASRLTPRGWLIAGGSAVVAILFMYLFVHTVSQPSYTTIVSGVQASETDKMTSALSAQGISYQRALQGQLDETIDSIQGVSGAQVELVLPSSQSQIFGESQSASSAAVLLSGTTALDQASVRGIAQLVA